MRHVLSVFSLALIATFDCIRSYCPAKAISRSHTEAGYYASAEKHREARRPARAGNALVRHTDTAQVFTFGDKAGPEFHAIVPNPATDAAHVGDTVDLTGFVRRFSADDFERDYRWFRRADYPDVHGGDWVIVATSVCTPEGTELVPPMTISTTPPHLR